MVKFNPFRGIRYNASLAGPLEALICPPYDVISEVEHQTLLDRSPYNMVRLELNERPEPVPPSRYTNAATQFNQWLESGLLFQDSLPSFYLLKQQFQFQGKTLERHSLTGALKLEKLGEGVLPHEDTAEAPKRDRLSLMEASSANFSPILALYQRDAQLEATIQTHMLNQTPITEFTAEDGQRYMFWQVTDSDSVRIIQDKLAGQQLFLADGHHRYETAINYRNQTKTNETTKQGFDHIMTSLVNFDDPGLLLLPYHRVIQGLTDELLGELMDGLRGHFLFQPTDLGLDQLEQLEALITQEQINHPILGLVAQSDGKFHILSLKEPNHNFLHDSLESTHLVNQVDSWLIQERLLRPILGDALNDHVTYVHDAETVVDLMKSGRGQLAFILRGLPTTFFRQIVQGNVRLPRKSTYFYPKLPSGLVINALTNRIL